MLFFHRVSGLSARTPLERRGSGVVRQVTFPGPPHDPPLFICRCFPVIYRCSVCAHATRPSCSVSRKSYVELEVPLRLDPCLKQQQQQQKASFELQIEDVARGSHCHVMLAPLYVVGQQSVEKKSHTDEQTSFLCSGPEREPVALPPPPITQERTRRPRPRPRHFPVAHSHTHSPSSIAHSSPNCPLLPQLPTSLLPTPPPTAHTHSPSSTPPRSRKLHHSHSRPDRRPLAESASERACREQGKCYWCRESPLRIQFQMAKSIPSWIFMFVMARIWLYWARYMNEMMIAGTVAQWYFRKRFMSAEEEKRIYAGEQIGSDSDREFVLEEGKGPRKGRFVMFVLFHARAHSTS